MKIIHKHSSRKRNIVLAIGGIIALSTSGFVIPQLTDALSYPSNSGAFTGSSSMNNPYRTGRVSSNSSRDAKTSNTSTPSQTNSAAPKSTILNPPSTSSTPPSTAPATTSPTAPVKTETVIVTKPATAPPVDTSAQVALTAKAQTVGASTTIVYHSNEISSETAMLIYRSAGITFALALAMLASTKLIPSAARRTHPVFSATQSAFSIN